MHSLSVEAIIKEFLSLSLPLCPYIYVNPPFFSPFLTVLLPLPFSHSLSTQSCDFTSEVLNCI